jgi:hypothetical protein
MLKGREKMMLDYYEEALRELEELEINLDTTSHNDVKHALRSIIDRGWLQVETMFGQRGESKYTKEEIQKSFNDMLNVVPMTRIRKKND